jgi:hypothetical protein
LWAEENKIPQQRKALFVMRHPMTTDSANIKRQKNEQKSQRFSKIKRGATPPTSRHTVAPHLILPQPH